MTLTITANAPLGAMPEGERNGGGTVEVELDQALHSAGAAIRALADMQQRYPRAFRKNLDRDWFYRLQDDLARLDEGLKQ